MSETWFTEQDRRRYSAMFTTLAPHLDEKTRRLLGAAMMLSLPRGGQKVIEEVTGLGADTLRSGAQQLRGERPLDASRVRAVGGGRKPITDVYPEITTKLLDLVAEDTQGDPESPLLWTTKSLRHLAAVLTKQGTPVSAPTVGMLLAAHGYSPQAPKKRFEAGSNQPGRDEQFRHINEETKAFMGRGSPIISIDAKKKELIGNYKNGGREYRPQNKPLEVNAHDFLDPSKGKAIPYGVYDPVRNEGWVSVGIDHDTSEFAVHTIERWWRKMGAQAYPDATELLITADGGGSNGSRTRLWKKELQRFSDETGLAVNVCHFPPGTSKWNAIEHRMFSAISMNWRARPLTSHEVVVSLIESTTTNTGLRIQCELDDGQYAIGQSVAQEDMDALELHKPEGVNQKWNYTLRPRGSNDPRCERQGAAGPHE